VQLRRGHRLFSRGMPTVLKDNPAAAGALAWRMTHEGEAALVVMKTDWPAGTVLQGLFGIDGKPSDLVVGPGGRITLKLPSRAGWVWQATPRRVDTGSAAAELTLEPLPSARVADDFMVGGTARGVPALRLVVDGDLAGAQRVVPGPDGRWRATVDTSRMVDPAVRHAVTAWSDDPAAGSASVGFQVSRPWTVVADVADPAGDDHGPAGRYAYPSHASWGSNRQMDLRGVKVSTAGGALRLDLKMNKVTTSWNPSNGFDHVAFTVFLELPGQGGGISVMPLQNANLPPGMRWHLRLRINGWSNVLFGADGASAQHEGTPLSPAASVSVDRSSDTVSLLLPAAALGKPRSLAGVKVYVTTWDYDGGYRALEPAPAPYAISGAAADGAKVMDSSEVIVLP
jgi:carbohydrate-binding DOMON domain-containing protein